MPITTNKLSMLLTNSEGKKEQVNIAQMNEIASILPDILKNNFSPEDILDWVYGGRTNWNYKTVIEA